MSIRILLTLIFVTAACSVAFSQTTPERQRNYPAPVEGDYTIKDFKFRSGETLPELKLHYMTLGTPAKDNSGTVRNAVLIMHGTGGTGAQFLSPQFANVLFGPGQLLDPTKYFIILPDAIGHGRSSKPSDGLHLKFPHYTYDDMVLAQYRLITEKLGVNHLRLVMGTSMGGMHTWVWGETYPEFMDALMPLASLPIEIAGRNRIMRKMIMDSIRNDPAWNNGEYKTQPIQGLTAAENILLLMGSAPLQWQKQAPTRDAADKFYEERVKSGVMRTDANDMLYYFDSSREYNPSPQLEKIKAPLAAINSADDMINPPELGVMEREIKRVKNGRYVLLPITDQTRGHGTHTIASIWQGYLKELLENSNQKATDSQGSAAEPDLINADRPGIADGSTVVGPKTFQIESGVQAEFRRDGHSREHTSFIPTLLRFGIDDHWEIRVEGNTYTRVISFQSTTTSNQTAGFAPLSLGFKYHIYDSHNDHQLSLGTIVRIFPTWGSKEFRTQHTTGDVRLAADWDFAPHLRLSLNPNIGVARYEDDQGRVFTAGLFALTLNYNPTKKLNPFIDLGVQWPEVTNGQTSAILDGGLAYIIGRNLQVDAGVGTRVHGDTGPRPFIGFGLSWRARSKHKLTNTTAQSTTRT